MPREHTSRCGQQQRCQPCQRRPHLSLHTHSASAQQHPSRQPCCHACRPRPTSHAARAGAPAATPGRSSQGSRLPSSPLHPCKGAACLGAAGLLALHHARVTLEQAQLLEGLAEAAGRPRARGGGGGEWVRGRTSAWLKSLRGSQRWLRPAGVWAGGQLDGRVMASCWCCQRCAGADAWEQLGRGERGSGGEVCHATHLAGS